MEFQDQGDLTVVSSVFVRSRNALLLRGQFTPIYTDYYLHLMQHGLRYPAALDQMLKDALAVMVLHLAARPWAETCAWTANLREPALNLFVTGGSLQQSVTGRIFTEDVRVPERNLFYSQTTSTKQVEPRTSTTEIHGEDPIDWLGQFYQQSEQRLARAYRLPDEHFVLVAAQPDCDLEWLVRLTAEQAATIEQDEETRLLETRNYRFHCGCTLEKILPILGGWRDRLDELFESADTLSVQCPRCAAKYQVSRAMLGG